MADYAAVAVIVYADWLPGLKTIVYDYYVSGFLIQIGVGAYFRVGGILCCVPGIWAVITGVFLWHQGVSETEAGSFADLSVVSVSPKFKGVLVEVLV